MPSSRRGSPRSSSGDRQLERERDQVQGQLGLLDALIRHIRRWFSLLHAAFSDAEQRFALVEALIAQVEQRRAQLERVLDHLERR